MDLTGVPLDVARPSSAIYTLALIKGESVKLCRKYLTNLKICQGWTRFFQFCHRDLTDVGFAKFVPLG